MNKRLLIATVGLISLLGVVALTTSIPSLTIGYIAVSTLLLLAVTIGGVITYNQQEMRDIREIRDEERKMHRESIQKLESRIAELEESLILKEKESINALNKGTAAEIRVELVTSSSR